MLITVHLSESKLQSLVERLRKGSANVGHRFGGRKPQGGNCWCQDRNQGHAQSFVTRPYPFLIDLVTRPAQNPLKKKHPLQ